jgi:hypothetical protein
VTDQQLKKSYLAAAVSAAGIIGAIVFYAVLVELLRHLGHKPPLVPPAAYAAKYALYILSAVSVFLVKPVAARLAGGQPTAEAAVKALTAQAIITAALCELPAVCGLILFLLAGYRADFYLLLVFSAGLEIYHFPRLARWQERLRSDFSRAQPAQGGPPL